MTAIIERDSIDAVEAQATSPLVAILHLRALEHAELLRNAELRRATRSLFFMENMLKEDNRMADRIRCAELGAKLDGDFIEHKHVRLTGGYNDMVRNARATKTKNLGELLEQIDSGEELEVEVVEDQDGY